MASQRKTQSPKSMTRCISVLQRVAANIFVADCDLKIIYVNPKGQEMLLAIEAEMKKAWGIRADGILGERLSRFGQDAGDLLGIVQRPSELPYTTEFTLDSVTLRATIDRANEPHGDFLGYVITWEDISEQLRSRKTYADFAGQVEAIGKSQAVIEFELDGTIIAANDRFLDVMGYRLDEIVGHHHSMFVDEATKQSPEYREFWERLRRGEYAAGEFKRLGKRGNEVWLQSSYNPILDLQGKPFKVVKYAANVTEQVQTRTDMARILETVTKSSEGLASAAGRAHAGEPADGRQRRGNLRSSQRGRIRCGAGQQQRHDRGDRDRRTDRQHR